MQKAKAVFRALIGYAGSSENPEKMSMRLMGIVMGVVSQFSPLISFGVVHLDPNFCPGGIDSCVANLSSVIQPIILTVACVVWVVGAVRAAWNAPIVAGIF